jgi:hypothetical protein
VSFSIPGQPKNNATTSAEYISDTQLKCQTPSFEDFNDQQRDLAITVSLANKMYSITSTPFSWFKVTDPAQCQVGCE